MLRTRAIVTLIGTPLVFLIVYLGGWFFFTAVALVMVLSIYEYNIIISQMGWHLRQGLLAPLVLLLLASGLSPSTQIADVTLAMAIIVSMAHALWQYEYEKIDAVLPRWFAFLAALILFGWMGSHLIRLRALDDTGQWTIAILAIIFAVDVGAYLIGRKWGKRPLSPRLSPKKSVEGYIGGLLFGVPLILLFQPILYPTIDLITLLWITVLFGLIMPAGDLFFSLLKREAGIKDASQIIPGHGGILDRLDTVLWGSTIAYYLLTLFIL